MAEVNANWFELIGDFILCPADVARTHPWTAHECISPGYRVVEDLEIWPSDAIEFYNRQPVWDLKDLKTTTGAQARMALTEFVEDVEGAANCFCWFASDPDESINWKQHGWKHVCWSEFVEVWTQHEAVEPAEKARAFGKNALRQLFKDALNENAEAVGRIWSLFPDQHDAIMGELFSEQQPVREIPLPGELAEKLINSMLIRAPFLSDGKICYPDVKKQGRELRRMISAIESKGMPIKKGRPRITVSPDTLRLLLKMGRCQSIQVRKVVNFLERNEIARKDQLLLLKNFYPWIEDEIDMDPYEFSLLSPSRAATQMVSKVSGISCSVLEKLGIDPSRDKNRFK